MQLVNKPYFLKNKKWYTYNNEKYIYELTKEAPKKAIESYNELYSVLNKTSK